VILRVYAKESKRIIFSLRITSSENQRAQLENQGAQLCQTDPNVFMIEIFLRHPLTLMKGENNQMKRVDSNNHGSDLMAVMH
jgi:hypothetical protein